MIKILISVYIAAVLLMAGLAEANEISNFQRVKNASKVWLNVGDARFDSRREVLSLYGNVAPHCLNSIQPEVNFDERTQSLLLSVTAEGQNCLAKDGNFYEIVIDVKALFAEAPLAQDALVNFVIDNYVGGQFTFKYFAKHQTQYSFNQLLQGTVQLDHRTGKFYLVGRGSRIEILSRFNLNDYENRFVQLKGLIPNNFAIGDDTSAASAKLIVGQLTALR